MAYPDCEKLLDLLYAGIADPTDLEAALQMAMAYLDASGANIHIKNKENLENVFFFGIGDGYTEEAVSAYLDHWQYVNAHRDAMRRAYNANGGQVFLCHEHITEEDWNKGGYFQNFFSQIGQRWLAGGIAWSGRSTEVSITFSRPHGAPHFGEDSRAFIAMLLPHVRRATRLALKLGAAHNVGFNSGLASARMPTFIVDSSGALKWTNAAGEELLDQSRLLRRCDGRLVVADPCQDRSFSRLIANAIDKRLAETPPAFLRAECGAEMLDLEVLPATVPSGALIGAHSLATVMARPRGFSPFLCDTLKEHHGLTDAECRLAMAMAQGASVEDAAATGGVSPHTIRTQLRSIFSKTGVNRQSALAALVWKTA